MATSLVNKKPQICKCRSTQRKRIKEKKVSRRPMTEKIDFLLGMQQIVPCLGNFYFTLLSECYEKFLFNCDESPAKEAMLERLFAAMGELDLITGAVADGRADDSDDVNLRVTDRSSNEQMPNVDSEENKPSLDFSTKLLRCMSVARKHSVSKKCQDGGRRLRQHEEHYHVIKYMQEVFRDTFKI